MRALQFITDHVIFKLCYNQIYQMKTTMYNVHLPTIYSFWIMQEMTFKHNQIGTGKGESENWNWNQKIETGTGNSEPENRNPKTGTRKPEQKRRI